MNLITLCQEAESIGITGHVRPDGDCVGSCMGLYLYLKKVFPGKNIKIFLEQPSAIFSCIRNLEEISILKEDKMEKGPVFDLFFAVDTSKDRTGGAEALFDDAKMTVNIDHHISNAAGTGKINYIKPEVSSSSELVYELLEEKYLDADIALALYIGIIHDTGVFQYSNTSPETLQAAAKLIRYGFDFPKLIDETFYEKTYVQNQILGRALLESFLFLDGKCAVSGIDKKTMDFYGASSRDLEGIVNQLRITKGVECAVFLYETDTLTYKVSLRSCGQVDVAKIAGFFGGGGHRRAAGCTMNGTYHDVINNLSVHIEEQLREDSA